MTILRGSLNAVTGTLPSFLRFSINYHLFHILDRVLFSMNLFVFINHFLSFQKKKSLKLGQTCYMYWWLHWVSQFMVKNSAPTSATSYIFNRNIHMEHLHQFFRLTSDICHYMERTVFTLVKNSKHLKTYDCQISMDFTSWWNTEANDSWNELVGIFNKSILVFENFL